MSNPGCHTAFEHVRSERLRSLDIDLHEFVHTGTGTPHIHLAAKNPENVFLVGLRTVPQDSTGVAHILEHTVLCGSEKYPVRDPFFMMIRRSLNTFMNAFTASDWTAYPFASQNRKDYFNLLDVYLDAVFFSRLHELDFAQEGHRVEFEKADDPDTDLVYKGVVFNEMKGAMSAPTSVLWQTLSKHLFPNNTYHYNSGGDPEAIPDLTHKQLVDFYRTHYHPSNAVFMTYGDIPAEELQGHFDEKVLKRFEPLERQVTIAPAQRYHSPIRVEEAYATEEDGNGDKTHIVMGWLLGRHTDLDSRLRAHLLSNVLLDNSASPLMKALEQTELGSSPSPMCGLDDDSLEMVFCCGLDGSSVENESATEQLILSVLEDVAENGVPQEEIDAVLHQFEMNQREIRGDGMPFGLQLVLSGLSTAMHRGDTLASIDLDPALERLREDAAKPGFISSLVRELMLDNPHRVTLTLRPDSQISERRNRAEIERLAKAKAELSEDEASGIVQLASALAARQAEVDDPDILPKVTLADVPSDLPIPIPEINQIKAGKVTTYAQGTNGLVYQHLIIDTPELPESLTPYLSMYSSYLTELGSGGRDYLQTQKRQAELTGGISFRAMQRGARTDEQTVNGFMVMGGKALARNSGALTELIQETLEQARFDEHARLRELIAQTRTSREQSITGSGHALAMMAASSGMSPTSLISHRRSGLEGIRTLKALDDRLDADTSAIAEVADAMSRIHQIVLTAPRQFMLVAEQEHLDGMKSELDERFGNASADADFTPWKPEPIREARRELWTTSTEVNFCAKAYQTVPSAHEDAAALSVLGPFLRNGYLHRAIRETGGAYGGGAAQDSDAASFKFYSYRDPRLTETLDDFDRSVEWLVETSHSGQDLEEAVLNVISGIDKPGSPAGEARSAFHAELFGRTPEHRRELRQRILNVTLDDLKRVGERYFAAGSASTGVVSSESRARESAVSELNLDRHSL